MSVRLKIVMLFGLLCFATQFVHAQQSATLKGKVTDESNRILTGATIYVPMTGNGASADRDGNFTLEIPGGKNVLVIVSFMGYDTLNYTLSVPPGQEQNVTFQLKFGSRKFDKVVEIEDDRSRTTTMTRIDPKSIDHLPMPNASIEKTLLFQGMGVSSNNEMSSQYNVRGGNFDENLIYINDVEIYRPFLVRAGQQEGLSLVNPKLTQSVEFSSGGFQSKYGDKMSSVLDIQYKKTRRKLGGSVEGSLLGGQIHLENASDNFRFTQIHGLRYRTNRYILGTLDTRGDYRPDFVDYQGYFTYELTETVELGLLLNYAQNKYTFRPEDRQTEFGTLGEALRLSVFFNGQEINNFETGLAALSATYRPTPKLKLKFIGSFFRTLQEERFDVEGAYRLDELDRDLGSDNFGEVAFNRGIGGYINHARNYMLANVATVAHKGTYFVDKYTFDWGLRGKMEVIEDQFDEWNYIDSSGYSIPNAPPFSGRNRIPMAEVIRARNDISSNRLMGYGQVTRELTTANNHVFTLNAGGRFHYWDFNNELVGGPRASVALKPEWKKNMVFKAAWGYYHQPAFYPEMRNIQGEINPDIEAQRAIHYVMGMDYIFDLWDRPFKFASEVYYKDYSNLVPYTIDNVRLRYFGTNNSNGYATGIDFKLNGEFVKGVQSWASMSISQVRERLTDGEYMQFVDAEGNRTFPGNPSRPVADSSLVDPGYIPRPTDQRVNFSLFFQDYFPGNPTIKMNLNLVFGTGLPFGPPNTERHQDTLRIPSYRRVDMGFSKQLLRYKSDDRKGMGLKAPFTHLNSIWLSVEVFNMLDVNNTISYLWIRDLNQRQYGVPNFLTQRQVNIRLIIDF